MLGLPNMREQCFLIAAVQNLKRLAKAFALLFCSMSSMLKGRAPLSESRPLLTI